MHQMWSKNLEFFNALTFHELTQESIKVYSDFHFVCSRLGNSNSCFNQFVCKNQGSTTYSRNKLFNHNCLKQILTVNQNHTIPAITQNALFYLMVNTSLSSLHTLQNVPWNQIFHLQTTQGFWLL